MMDAEPSIIGHCAYCQREIYDVEMLYKEPDGAGKWIRVCAECASMSEIARPANRNETIRDTMPRWEP